MWQEFQRRAATDNPVRFVITVGDNIYADVNLGRLILRSGDEDLHWRRKFFEPYREILRQVPWYPTLGNHDGNETENRGDLSVYLDNFLFPDGKSHRWYNFSYGGLAEFFALDSSENSEQGVPAPVFGEDGEQFRWLKKQLPDSKAPWKIPYFHHPPFTAGPFHGASYATLKHFVDLFGSSGVKVAFNGHEHNLQFSARNAATRDVLYVISGAGGELRRGDVTANMERANMAAWAPQRHFLAVEIEGRTMAIQPVSYEPVTVFDRNRRKVEMPATISLDAGATLHSAAQASPPE
jgi:hypothetical protein